MKEISIITLFGEKYPPFKGTYYRLFYDRDEKQQLIFSHIIKDIDTNDEVYGIPANQLNDFIFLAESHGFEVNIANRKD